MAIFHLSTKIIGRSAGQSAVAAAAYRAGVKLVQKVMDAATGAVRNKVHNYENKDGVSHKEIVVPEGFERDEWLKDRQALWQKVEDCERRKDSQLARQIVIALPKELSEEENIELAVNFAKEVLAKDGMVVDVAVHYDNPDNPHAHLLMTMRNLERDENGEAIFGYRNLDWNSKQKIVEWRAAWEKMLNMELKIRGFEMEVSAASFKDRGIDLVATKHEGKTRHIERLIRVKEFNEDARLANLQAIRENPEVLIDMIQSRRGVFDRDDVVRGFKEVLFGGCGGKLSLLEEEELVRGVEGIMSSEKLVRISDRGFDGKVMYAGKYPVKREKELMCAANELKSRYGHMVSMLEGGKIDEQLSEQQDLVVRGVLGSSDLAIVQGLPGAGKSTIAKVIAKEYEKLGYRVFGTAVTAAACKNLHEITDMRVETIAHMKTKWNWLEKDGKAIDFGSRDVLIIDEMSMVSLSDMGYLLGKAAQKGAKVIALGDVNQFAAIKEHGAANKLIEIADVFELNQVKRMKNPEHSRAAEMMADKKIEEAIGILDKQGVFRLLSSRLVARENLVLDYVSKYGELVEGGEGKHLGLSKKMIVLAHTNKEVGALNRMIRAELKSLGVLGAEDKQVKVGSRRMSFAVGEQVVFGRNDKDLGVINGDMGVIAGIREFEEYSGGRYASVKVKLSTGKKVTIDTKEYGDISYGYAITAYKAQGGTYDHVYVVHEKGLKYEAFNVMMTRHEKSLGIYVNDEDLKIKSVLQDAKRVEVVQKLAHSLSKYNDKALVVDYDFESVEAKNIQHYLGIKAEVKEEIELFRKWKQEQMLEKGFVPSISNYEGINDFMDKMRLRKAAAGLILDDFDKHKRLASVANISKGLLERQVNPKEKIILSGHLRLKHSNWKEEVLSLTDKWLEYQEELMDSLDDKELQLSQIQLEYEQDKLKLGYLNHYRSGHQVYLGQIYKDSYWSVCDKWRVLVQKYGEYSEERLIQMVNNKPRLLGDLRGKLGWYDADQELKEARALAKNVGESMVKAFANSDEKDLYDRQMREKGLEQKIEKLSAEVRGLSQKLAESTDHKFMYRLKSSVDLLRGKEDLNKWASLITKSQVVSKVTIDCLVEEVFTTNANSLYKNIWKYKSTASGLHDLVVRMADWYSKESAEYPGSNLFAEYKKELEHLKKSIIHEKGWQKVVEAKGLCISNFAGHVQEERGKIINALSLGANKENIARLAEIYLDEKVKVCEEFIELKSSYASLQKEFSYKRGQRLQLRNKKDGELGNLSNVYQDSPDNILNAFKELRQKEGSRAFEIVKEDPEVLGKLKGFGVGKIIMSLDRVRAYELSVNAVNSIKNIFRLEAEIEKLNSEIGSIRYEDKLNNLSAKICLMQMHELNIKKIQSLSKLKCREFDQGDLEVLERLADKRILDKEKFFRVNSPQPQREIVRFEDVANQLRAHDYERIFRQYANTIVQDNAQIKMHGSSISCGSLNMNLDNGLWIRFSTNESGNIFHFIQQGAGLSKIESLDIVAGYVGCAGISGKFIKKDELEFIPQEVQKEQRLVPKFFDMDLTKEDFEQRFAYLCKENKLEALHCYRDVKDNILGYTARLVNQHDGSKQVLPVACLYDKELNKTKVALKAFSDQKLIYGLEKLHDNKTVLIVEGEKTADIAQNLFPEMNVISWLGGSNSAQKVDWSYVQNKQVIIWPDNDAPGIKAAENIRDHLLALDVPRERVAIVDVKDLNLPEKWDLGDKLPEDLSKEQIKELVSINDKDCSLKQIKLQAKEIALELEEKLDKLLDPEDSLKVWNHAELQQFKHPRLSKEIVQEVALHQVFEESIKTSTPKLSSQQMDKIAERIEFELEHIAYAYENLSYEKIELDPESFKRFYSEKGPSNRLLLQQVRLEASYKYRMKEMGSMELDMDINAEFQKTIDQVFKDHYMVRELNETNRDVAQSLAEQIADYGLKYGSHTLTTKRLEIMHDIATEEHKHLDSSLQSHLVNHKELDVQHDHFKEMNPNLGRAFRDHILDEHIHHHDKTLEHDHHQMQHGIHHDHHHHNIQRDHHHDMANRLTEQAIQHHLDHMHREQHLDRHLVLERTMDLHK